MKRFLYLKLRQKIFSDEVSNLKEQLKNFSLMLLLFLYTSLPGLAFAALLTVAAVFDNELPSAQLLLLMWVLLAIQLLSMIVFRPAITGDNYALFLRSLHVNKRYEWLATLLLSLPVQPILLLHLFLLTKVSLSDWPQLSHVFVFVVIQIGLSLFVFANTKLAASFIALAAFVMLIARMDVFESVPINYFLLALLIAQILMWLARLIFHKSSTGAVSNVKWPSQLPIEMRFWLEHLRSCKSIFFFQLAVSSIVIMLAIFSAEQMPRNADYMNFAAGALIILVSASAFYPVSKLIEQHALFFAQFAKRERLLMYQFSFPSLVGVLCLFTLALFQIAQQSMMMFIYQCIAFIICLALVKLRPKAFAIIWLMVSGVLGLILFK